jgi:hypothetical protein
MLDAANPIAIFVRLCVFFHLFTIMALIFANERALIFMLIYGKQEIESNKITYALNLALLIPGLLLSVFYPAIGELAGYLASISGFLCIYAMPSIVYMKQKHIEANNPKLGRILAENRFKVLAIREGKGFQAPEIVFDDEDQEKLDDLGKLSVSSDLRRKFKPLAVLLTFLIIYGFLIITLQYIPLTDKK